MKDGSFESSSKSSAKETKSFTEEDIKKLIAEQIKPADDTKERMSDLIQKVAEAKAAGEMWVETTADNIRLLQPKGLNGAKYFCWQGVKVCEFGKIDEIERDESMTVHDRMHPNSGTKIISGAS